MNSMLKAAKSPPKCQVLHSSLSAKTLSVLILLSVVQAFITEKYAMPQRHLFFSNCLTIAEIESWHQIVFAEELLLCMFFLHLTHFGKPFSEQK